MLIAGDSSFSQYLALQNYDEEIAHLEKKYGPPWGRLFLARWEGQKQPAASACGGWTAKTAR